MADALDPRVQQIYNLKALSRQYRDGFYGPRWFESARMLFELMNPVLSASSFRPTVNVPQFQQLALMEATDLSAISPRVYIQRAKSQDEKSERDKDREAAFDDHWDWIMASSSLFMAELWAMFAGTGWLELNHDPLGDNGNGQLCQSWLDPEDVYPDPFARWQDPANLRWSYVIIERIFNLNVVKAQWSAFNRGPGALIRETDASAFTQGSVPRPGQQPAMPIRTLWGAGSPDQSPTSRAGAEQVSTGTVRGHVCFVMDYSEHEPSELRSTKVGDTDIFIPAGRFRYPFGRMLIEAGGEIMFDGHNWAGGFNGENLFPVVPIYAMPPLTSIWGIPPWRFSSTLESLAQQTISQNVENIIRCNNAVVYVPQDCNIDTSAFGALPGEIVEIAAGSKPPTHTWGNPMPAHVFQQPQYLLDLSRKLQGYEAPRMGEASQGNVGADLQDAVIGEGRKLTRMRSLLLYPSLNLLTKLLYGGMCRCYKSSRSFPSFNSEERDESMWKPGGEMGSCRLDPGAVAIVGEAALQRLTIQLRQLGLISKSATLEGLRVPHAEDLADEVEQEEKLQALSALRKR
jgi:hypothetical protein